MKHSHPTLPPQGGGDKRMSLSSTSVTEEVAGAHVGVLTTVAPNNRNRYSFSVDDPRFDIAVGDGETVLCLRSGVVLDHETTPSVDVTITVTDQAGLSVEHTFTIAVTDVNEAPTDITLSNATVEENMAGAVIGELAGSDPEGDTLSFLVVGPEASVLEAVQDSQSGAWQLRLKAGIALNHEQTPSSSVTVRVSDGLLTYDKVLTVTTNDVNEAPTSVSLDGGTVAENEAGATIGRLSVVDPEGSDTVSYEVLKADASGALLLVNGNPVIDTRFTVDGTGNLKLAADLLLDHEGTPTIAVVVRATDPGSLSRDEVFSITVSDLNDAPMGTLSISSSTRMVETATTRVLKASDITSPSNQFFNPANNHIYEFVNTDVRWDQALSLSAAKVLGGVQGHLVTITSAAEQAFIMSHMGLITVGWNGDEIWTAASDYQQEGNWIWMAGPEQGQAVTFSDWAWPGGPSNFKVGADYGVLTVSPFYDTAGAWMDLDQEWFVGGSRTWENGSMYSHTYRGNGYVVEYSGQLIEKTLIPVETLTADASLLADQDGLGDISYQWQRSSDGLSWNDISGAVEEEYEVGQDDHGAYLRAHATYLDGGGTLEHVYSAPEFIPADTPPEEPPVDTRPDGLIELDGHYYKIVEGHSIGRADALLAAEDMGFSFEGVEYRGHLATVTSAQEEAFIETAILNTNNGSYFTSEPAAFWLGGEYKNVSWQWASGPERGHSLSYSDWGGGEAGQGSSEPYLVLNMFGRSDINGVWYSYDAGDRGYVRGYVVEFEPLA